MASPSYGDDIYNGSQVPRPTCGSELGNLSNIMVKCLYDNYDIYDNYDNNKNDSNNNDNNNKMSVFRFTQKKQ